MDTYAVIHSHARVLLILPVEALSFFLKFIYFWFHWVVFLFCFVSWVFFFFFFAS